MTRPTAEIIGDIARALMAERGVKRAALLRECREALSAAERRGAARASRDELRRFLRQTREMLREGLGYAEILSRLDAIERAADTDPKEKP